MTANVTATVSAIRPNSSGAMACVYSGKVMSSNRPRYCKREGEGDAAAEDALAAWAGAALMGRGRLGAAPGPGRSHGQRSCTAARANKAGRGM